MAANELKRSGKGLEAVLADLRGLQGLDVTVGVQGREAQQAKEGEDSTATLGMVAAVMEFGDEAELIPSRSYLRSTLDDKRKEWTRHMRLGTKRVLAGESKSTAFLAAREAFQYDVQATITSHPPPLLSEDYAEAIGVPRGETLIRTGQLRNSIRGQVEQGGREIG